MDWRQTQAAIANYAKFCTGVIKGVQGELFQLITSLIYVSGMMKTAKLASRISLVAFVKTYVLNGGRDRSTLVHADHCLSTVFSVRFYTLKVVGRGVKHPC